MARGVALGAAAARESAEPIRGKWIRGFDVFANQKGGGARLDNQVFDTVQECYHGLR